MKNNFPTIKILKIASVLILLWALADNPYAYYQILRWIIFSVAGYSAYLAYEDKEVLWAWIFGIVAILFNPISPFYFDREVWSVLNVVVAGILLVSIVKRRSVKILNE